MQETKDQEFGIGGYIFASLEDDANTALRQITIGNVGELAKQCYSLGTDLNPLPALRKRYPKFNWKLIDFSEEDGYDEMMERVMAANFVWYVGSRVYVTASAKCSDTEAKIFWSGGGCQPYDEHDRQRDDYIAELERMGFTICGGLLSMTSPLLQG